MARASSEKQAFRAACRFIRSDFRYFRALEKKVLDVCSGKCQSSLMNTTHNTAAARIAALAAYEALHGLDAIEAAPHAAAVDLDLRESLVIAYCADRRTLLACEA